MGIQTELPAAPVTAENRTWRIQIECGFDLPVADRSVTYLREVVPLDAQGNRAGSSTQSNVAVGNNGAFPLSVTATAAQILPRSFTDPSTGKTMTGADMMSMLSYIGDTLWQEAVAAELVRQTPPE